MRAALLASVLLMCLASAARAQPDISAHLSAADAAPLAIGGVLYFGASPTSQAAGAPRPQGAGLHLIWQFLTGRGPDLADRLPPETPPTQNPTYLLQW